MRGWIELCELQHVTFVIDDLQWADRSTLDTLMYVVARARCDGVSHWSRQSVAKKSVRATRCSVGSRTSVDCPASPNSTSIHSAARRRVSRSVHCSAPLRINRSLRTYTGRTRGNPYFNRLMIAGLLPDARAVSETFPSDLRSAVLQSWYRLPAPTRQLATVLAVGGAAMHADELAQVVGTNTEVDEVRDRLHAAVDAGTLDLRADGAFWFHHPMNAEVLEAVLAEDERRAWHLRFAELHQARFSNGSTGFETVVAIADHRYRAGDARAAL